MDRRGGYDGVRVGEFGVVLVCGIDGCFCREDELGDCLLGADKRGEFGGNGAGAAGKDGSARSLVVRSSFVEV